VYLDKWGTGGEVNGQPVDIENDALVTFLRAHFAKPRKRSAP
jgi:hypothetical protein